MLGKNTPQQQPGWCMNQKTPQCNIPLEHRGRVCVACQQVHLHDTLKKSHTHITLNDITSMGPREITQYIYHNKLWKKSPYSAYRPIANNPLSRGKISITTKSFEDLSMGHIYHIFEQMITTATNNDYTRLIAQGVSTDDIQHTIQSSRDQWFEGNSEWKKDANGQYVLADNGNKIRNDYKDMITETILYNLNAEKLEKHNITHTVGKLNNTLFDEYTNKRMIAHLRTKFGNLQEIPELTKKKERYNSLSDQIADILDGNAPWPEDLNHNPIDKTLLGDYFDAVCMIEGLVLSDKHLGDNVVKDTLSSICGYLTDTHGIDAKDVIRVDSKDPIRSVEKTLTKNNFDLRKLTDMSRGSIKCRSVKDLVDKMGKFREACCQHNKSVADKSGSPSVVEMGLVSKFGSIMAPGPLPSGYRDAKYHIKLSNGAVIEMQFQVDVLYEGKVIGFTKLNGMSNTEVIKKLHFSTEEKDTIRTAIQEYGIDLGGHDFFDLPSNYPVAGDTVYSLYRSLPGFDPKHTTNPTIQKLQLYEREIHSEGWLRNMKNIMRQEQKTKRNKKNNSLREKMKK